MRFGHNQTTGPELLYARPVSLYPNHTMCGFLCEPRYYTRTFPSVPWLLRGILCANPNAEQHQQLEAVTGRSNDSWAGVQDNSHRCTKGKDGSPHCRAASAASAWLKGTFIPSSRDKVISPGFSILETINPHSNCPS